MSRVNCSSVNCEQVASVRWLAQELKSYSRRKSSAFIGSPLDDSIWRRTPVGARHASGSLARQQLLAQLRGRVKRFGIRRKIAAADIVAIAGDRAGNLGGQVHI